MINLDNQRRHVNTLPEVLKEKTEQIRWQKIPRETVLLREVQQRSPSIYSSYFISNHVYIET